MPMNFTSLLHWTLILLIVALLAALLGFTGIAGAAAGIAKLLFWIAIILAVVSFMVHTIRST
jgi:uncharacterized membrane protein YtjA (UPF0391 family)